MFADSRSYPSMTIAGMYKQEQELAKAEGAGLVITALDLRPVHCYECGKAIDNMLLATTLDDLNWVHDNCLMVYGE